MATVPVLQAAEKARQQILAHEVGIAKKLAIQYGRIYANLEAEVTALAAQVDLLPERAAFRRAQLNSLQAQVKTELDRYAGWADLEIAGAAEDVVDLTRKQAEQMVFAGFPPGLAQSVGLTMQHVNTEQLISLMGFMDPQSSVRQKLVQDLGEFTAQGVADGLFEAIARGWNPRKIAAQFRKDFGMGLTDSLRTSRTIMLWAARDATIARYGASGVVESWEWCAAHNPRTCMGCIAMDGTIHPLSEPLDDHHNGRCVALPVTPSWRELGLPVDETPGGPTGAEWFATLDEEAQRVQFSNDKLFQAYQAGDVPWDKLVTTYDDPAFGTMRRQVSFTDLFGRVGAGQ